MIDNVSTLNKKVDILSGVSGDYDGFDTIADHVLYKNIWASITPQRGKETFERVEKNANQHLRADEKTKITIRHRAGIDEGCKVVYHKHVYEVQSVVDPNMTHELLELHCIEKKRGKSETVTRLLQTQTGEAWET